MLCSPRVGCELLLVTLGDNTVRELDLSVFFNPPNCKEKAFHYNFCVFSIY